MADMASAPVAPGTRSARSSRDGSGSSRRAKKATVPARTATATKAAPPMSRLRRRVTRRAAAVLAVARCRRRCRAAWRRSVRVPERRFVVLDAIGGNGGSHSCESAKADL
jgi:hypothetical protein